MGIEFKEAIERQRKEQEKWLKKHRILIRALGISDEGALSISDKVTDLQKHLEIYLVIVGKFLVLILLIGALFCCIHYYFIEDAIKSWYVAANYLGLIGTFFGFYGFLIHSKELYQQREVKFRRYTVDSRDLVTTCKTISDHLKEHERQILPEMRTEGRKVIAVLIAFGLFTASFVIQIILQFF